MDNWDIRFNLKYEFEKKDTPAGNFKERLKTCGHCPKKKDLMFNLPNIGQRSSDD